MGDITSTGLTKGTFSVYKDVEDCMRALTALGLIDESHTKNHAVRSQFKELRKQRKAVKNQQDLDEFCEKKT